MKIMQTKRNKVTCEYTYKAIKLNLYNAISRFVIQKKCKHANRQIMLYNSNRDSWLTICDICNKKIWVKSSEMPQ